MEALPGPNLRRLEGVMVWKVRDATVRSALAVRSSPGPRTPRSRRGSGGGPRIRGGPHVPFDLLDARAAALEAPEVQVPVPANFFFDETAAHFHGDTTRGYAVGGYEVIAVLSCLLSSDLALERQRGNLAKSFAFPAASFSFLRMRSIPNRW